MPDHEADLRNQEPTGKAAVQPTPAAKSRRSFSKLRRELTDDELVAPAVQRLMLDELDRLEKEIAELNQLRDKYHAADKRASVLEEKLKRWDATDMAHALCLTAGSALIGYAPSTWEKPTTAWVLLAIGVVLVLGAIVAKARLK